MAKAHASITCDCNSARAVHTHPCWQPYGKVDSESARASVDSDEQKVASDVSLCASILPTSAIFLYFVCEFFCSCDGDGDSVGAGGRRYGNVRHYIQTNKCALMMHLKMMS